MAAANKHRIALSSSVNSCRFSILARTETNAFPSPANVFSTVKSLSPVGSLIVYRSVAANDFSGALFFLLLPSRAILQNVGRPLFWRAGVAPCLQVAVRNEVLFHSRVGQRLPISQMISSAQRTASEVAPPVAGTRLPPWYCASFRAARMHVAIGNPRLRPSSIE